MIAKNDLGAALQRQWGLRANRGAQVTCIPGTGLVAHPLLADGSGSPDTRAAPVALPPVPVHLVQEGAGLLRYVGRTRGASAELWLYLHPRTRRWTTFCPPQLCGETDVQVDVAFTNCRLLPDPESVLAGSLRSVPRDAGDQAFVEPLLARHQGLHMVLDRAVPLTCLHAYVRTVVGVTPVAASAWVDDPLEPGLENLSDRLAFKVPAAAPPTPPTPRQGHQP